MTRRIGVLHRCGGIQADRVWVCQLPPFYHAQGRPKELEGPTPNADFHMCPAQVSGRGGGGWSKRAWIEAHFESFAA